MAANKCSRWRTVREGVDRFLDAFVGRDSSAKNRRDRHCVDYAGRASRVGGGADRILGEGAILLESVLHKHGNVGIRHDITRRTAEHAFADTRMPISSHHE